MGCSRPSRGLCVRGTGKLKAAICHLQVLETWWLQSPSTRRCAVTHPAPVLQPPPRDEHMEKSMEGWWSCLAAATSAFRGEAAHTARGRHPSQVRFPLELRGHIPMFSFQVLKPSVLPFPTAKEWEQTPGGLCVRPWGARVAAGSRVEPGAVCAEVGGSPLESCCTCRMVSYS